MTNKFKNVPSERAIRHMRAAELARKGFRTQAEDRELHDTLKVVLDEHREATGFQIGWLATNNRLVYFLEKGAQKPKLERFQAYMLRNLKENLTPK